MGAPNGNKNARKSQDEKSESITISIYIKDHDYDWLGKSVEYEGRERNKKNIRAKATKIMKDAINLEVRRTFARMEREFDQERAESGLSNEEFLEKWIAERS
jgi:hypothetical protein